MVVADSTPGHAPRQRPLESSGAHALVKRRAMTVRVVWAPQHKFRPLEARHSRRRKEERQRRRRERHLMGVLGHSCESVVTVPSTDVAQRFTKWRQWSKVDYTRRYKEPVSHRVIPGLRHEGSNWSHAHAPQDQ